MYNGHRNKLPYFLVSGFYWLQLVTAFIHHGTVFGPPFVFYRQWIRTAINQTVVTRLHAGIFFLVVITNKMQLGNGIYYFSVHWKFNMFRAVCRSSSGAPTVFAASGLHTHAVTARSQVWLGTGLKVVIRRSKNTRIPNFMKICPVGAGFFHADRDRHDEANSGFSQFCERA